MAFPYRCVPWRTGQGGCLQARLDRGCSTGLHLPPRLTCCASLRPPDNYGSISTLPGPTRTDDARHEQRISGNLIRAVAHCVKLAQSTGGNDRLAIEPEPCCMLGDRYLNGRFFRAPHALRLRHTLVDGPDSMEHAAADAAMHRI